METMLVSIEDISYESNTSIISIQKTLSVGIHQELKKQTGVLISIAKKLKLSSNNENAKKDSAESIKLTDSLNKFVENLYNVNNKSADKIEKIFSSILTDLSSNKKDAKKDIKESVKLTDSLSKFIEHLSKIDDKAADKIEKIFSSISTGLKNIQDTSKDASKTLKIIGTSILEFTKSLCLASILAPFILIGSFIISKSISILVDTITNKKTDTKQMNAIIALGAGMLKYTLALSLVSVLAPFILIGSFIISKSISILLDTIRKKKTNVKQMDAIIALGSGMLKYTLALSLAAVLAPAVLIGALVIGLSIQILMTVVSSVDKKKTDAIKSILTLSAGILLYCLSMLAVTLLAPTILKGTIIFTISLFILSLGLLFMGSKQVQQGVKALLWTGFGILLFAVAIWAFSKIADMETSLIVGLTIAGISLVMYMVGLNASTIIKGAISLIGVSLGLVVLSLGLLMFKAANITISDAFVLGAVITGLAIAVTIMGGDIALMLLGSAAMVATGASLIVLSIGLLIFKTANITLEDAGVLGVILVGLGVAMSGAGLLSIPIALGAAAMTLVGISLISISTGLLIFKKVNLTEADTVVLGSVIDTLALSMSKLGWLSIPIAAGSVVMTLAGVALSKIATSLTIFKASKFSSADGVNLESAIGSVISAFSIITDKDKQKALGIDINPLSLAIGIASLSGIGNVLSSLAQGVQSWANLEVTEWQVINPGTSKAQLVVKNRKKLTQTDFSNAALGIAQVINATAAPFAAIGKLQNGTASGIPAFDSIFGGNYVSDGIKSLANIGNTLGSLAKGISAWGNMSYLEFEVVGSGTKNAKLVPKGYKQIDIKSATTNIRNVLNVIPSIFAEIGRGEDKSSIGWGDGSVEKGVKAVSGIGNTIATIAKGISDIANGQFITYTVVNGKLTPSSTVALDFNMMKTSAYRINTLLGIFALGFSQIGQTVIANQDKIDAAINVLPNIGKIISSSVKIASDWSTIKDSDKIGPSISTFLTNVLNTFDSDHTPKLQSSLAYMNVFTSNMEKMSASNGGIYAVAKNSQVIAKSMKLTKEAINGMDLKKLTLTDSLMKSLAVIAKNPDAMAKAVEGGINKAFEDLTKALTDLAKETKHGHEATTSAIKESAITPDSFKPGGNLSLIQNTTKPNSAMSIAKPSDIKDNGGLTDAEIQTHMKDSMTQDFIAALNAVVLRVKVQPGF